MNGQALRPGHVRQTTGARRLSSSASDCNGQPARALWLRRRRQPRKAVRRAPGVRPA